MEENKNYKVKAVGITKRYEMFGSQSNKLKNSLIGDNKKKSFWALEGLSFEILDSDIIGIVGTNGSGKSTLLDIISGVLPQTSGIFDVKGNISVVSIDSGLNWNLTGRENIRLKQLMMGKTNKEIDEVEQEIIDFSELGKFVDMQVKTYSSGMRSKLGFSIAVYDNPDILVIDEALSVGDNSFSQKALLKIQSFIDEGKTIFFVSHSMEQVRQFTNKVMWIQNGKLREFSETDEVLQHYEEYIDWLQSLGESEKNKYIVDKKSEQSNFDISDLKNNLKSEGYSSKEVDKITKSLTFNGLNPIKMLSSIAFLGLVLIFLIGRIM